MKIQFEKVGSAQKPFETESEGIRLQGTLQKSGYHAVALDGRLSGEIALSCDRCGRAYQESVEMPLKLTLQDQLPKDKEDLDIIEFLDGVIDITYILESEINAIKSTYHYCPDCDGSDEALEIEY